MSPYGALHHELGKAAFDKAMAAQRERRIDDAIAGYRRAIRQNPGMVAAHFNLGQLLRGQGDYPGAAICFEGAARLRPTSGDAWLNLGEVLERVERHSDAIASYRRAAACDPNDPRPGNHLGHAFLTLGDYRQAREAFKSVIESHPDNGVAHGGLAAALLLSGNFGAGWEQYEHRWPSFGIDPATRFKFPLWRGEPITDRRILVWREQGLGEELLFLTCLEDLVAIGAHVTYATSATMVPLLRRSLPKVTIIEEGHWGEGLKIDYHLPVGSLPSRFRNTRIDFPSDGKFLVPESELTARWAAKLERLGAGPRVGVSWRGSSRLERSRVDCALADWSGVFKIPGVTWVNLQLDESADEIEEAKTRFDVTLHRWPKEKLESDLDNLAGLVANLDAVITVHTGMSALAGALGIRAWEVVNSYKWSSHGEEKSPWFPSIRFARKRPGQMDWSATLDAVAEELGTVAVEGTRT